RRRRAIRPWAGGGSWTRGPPASRTCRRRPRRRARRAGLGESRARSSSAVAPLGGFRPRDAVQVAFERVEPRRPEAAEWQQPSVELLQRFRLEPVDAALRGDRGLDEARLAQDAVVLRDGRLRQEQSEIEVADGAFFIEVETEVCALVRYGGNVED